MRMFGAVAFAGLTGAAILKIIATLLAPLWAALAAIIAGWIATLGALVLGWLVLGLKVFGVLLLGVFAFKWIKKKTSEDPA